MTEISWATPAEFPWVCPYVGRQRTVLETLLRAEGVAKPSQVTECGSVAFVKSVVANSDQLAMLPAHAVSTEVKEAKLRLLSITAPKLNRNIAVLFRERSSLDDASRDLVASVAAMEPNLAEISLTSA